MVAVRGHERRWDRDGSDRGTGAPFEVPLLVPVAGLGVAGSGARGGAPDRDLSPTRFRQLEVCSSEGECFRGP